MHRKPHTEQTKEKLRQFNKKNNIKPPSRKGSKWSKEQTEKMRAIMTGRKITWGKKLSVALKGNTNSKGKKKPKEAIDKIRGDKNKNWKGEDVSYSGMHHWIKRCLGKPKICLHCGSTRNLQWANKTRKYEREISNWISLCVRCHAKYDGVSEKMKLKWRNQYASAEI